MTSVQYERHFTMMHVLTEASLKVLETNAKLMNVLGSRL